MRWKRGVRSDAFAGKPRSYGAEVFAKFSLIVPTLRVGMPQGTLRVPALEWDAERPGLHSFAARGNDQV
jgi:hypothetical protein